MTIKSCLVIGAGYDKIDLEFILAHTNFKGNYTHFVYCADGGYQNASKLGINIDKIIGDCDSISADSILNNETGRGTTLELLPQEKDETDLFACAIDGLKLGFKDFTFLFATGGRLDHYMGALAILEYLDSKGAKGRIIDSNNLIMYLKNGEILIKNDSNYKYLSIIPLDEEIYGVSTQGLKYSLKNATMYRKFGLGISNEIVDEKCTILVSKGSALIIRSVD